jgi:hypothetical protein
MVYNETSRQTPAYFLHQFKIILLKQIQLLPISRQTRNHLRGWSPGNKACITSEGESKGTTIIPAEPFT